MLVSINRDKKMADTLEAVAGAVTQICGLPTTYQLLKSIGVVENDYHKLKFMLKQYQEQ